MSTTILIQLSTKDLQDLIRQAVRDEVSNLTKDQDNTMLSRRQVAERFKISLVTLNQWDKNNVLPSTKVGGRRVYRERDIQQAIDKGLNKWQRT